MNPSMGLGFAILARILPEGADETPAKSGSGLAGRDASERREPLREAGVVVRARKH